MAKRVRIDQSELERLRRLAGQLEERQRTEAEAAARPPARSATQIGAAQAGVSTDEVHAIRLRIGRKLAAQVALMYPEAGIDKPALAQDFATALRHHVTGEVILDHQDQQRMTEAAVQAELQGEATAAAVVAGMEAMFGRFAQMAPQPAPAAATQPDPDQQVAARRDAPEGGAPA